jgi:tRNA A-37 threonylcarbamoyl transferase component Bud32
MEDRSSKPAASPPRPDAKATVVADSVEVAKAATSPPPPPKVDPYLGKTIDGRYLVEGVLGEGGMGVVYVGRHKVIGKKVAIKVLRGEMARDNEITERFLQEARAASSIGNPHIIDISDFGTLPDGATYFVMEYLAGGSLSAAMDKAKAIPVPRLLHITKQIASGLGAAHDAGIIHRDLKPDNIMLITRGGGDGGKDFVKILDFGIAKVGGEASRLTRAGSVFGTPHYMSPEQAAGTSVDLRTDIYALGIILYEMASGKVPFDADNFMGILTQHMYKAPVPLLALVPAPEIPPSLDAIIQKCLTKKVEGRYATMAALLLDIEKLERGETPAALGEMMARSGGFNVPADYFRASASAMPTPVPATPDGVPKKGKAPLLIAMAAVATLGIAALAVTLARPTSTHAEGIVISALPPPVAPPSAVAPPPSAIAPPTAAAAAPSATVQHIAVVIEPLDAKVVREGEGDNLNATRGKEAFGIDVTDGVPVTLTASAAGYKTRKVTVDGSVSPLIVRLDPLGAPTAKPKSAKPAEPAAPQKKCDPLFDSNCDPFK